MEGRAAGEERQFSVAISEKQQGKLRFHIGDEVSGTVWTKKYAKWEYADYYRAGSLSAPREEVMTIEQKICA